ERNLLPLHDLWKYQRMLIAVDIHKKTHLEASRSETGTERITVSWRLFVWRSSLFPGGFVFILCVNLWRYSHLMGSSILTLWGHGQSKSLFLQPRHSHVGLNRCAVGI